jgi:hypothetical protein
VAERSVWPVGVVVVGVLLESDSGMPLVDDQNAVEEFAAGWCRRSVRRWHWPAVPVPVSDDADVDCGEDGVKGGGELGVAVPDEEPEAAAGVVEIHAEVAGLLGQPGAGGMGGDAEQVHPAGGALDDEERVQGSLAP